MAEDEELVALSVEPLTRRHKRADFGCGVEPLDRYLKEQASQDSRRSVAAPFVLITPRNEVVGYYTLSAFALDLPTLPAAQVRRLPKYPKVPATLLGRLAVDRSQHGQGLGEFLLMDALARSCRAASEVASYALVVDAINESAIAFYEAYGFIRFPETANRLFLPMNTIKSLFT